MRFLAGAAIWWLLILWWLWIQVVLFSALTLVALFLLLTYGDSPMGPAGLASGHAGVVLSGLSVLGSAALIFLVGWAGGLLVSLLRVVFDPWWAPPLLAAGVWVLIFVLACFSGRFSPPAELWLLSMAIAPLLLGEWLAVGRRKVSGA